MSPRTITVIIVTYRSAALTVACLRSLLPERAESGLIVNAIVVDNASGDEPEITAAIETEGWDSWVTLIVAPRNGGFAYGNNLGAAHALKHGSPDYLHLLNPDTLATPGCIRALADFLDAHPRVGIVGSSFECEGRDWPIAFRFPSLISEFQGGLNVGVVSKILKRWSVVRVMGRIPEEIDWGAGASMMIRSELYTRIGGLDEHYFLYFEETDFCWRARCAGYPMWYVPQSRVVHFGGQSTKMERGALAKRLPSYWYESRRRYFMLTKGLLQSILIDLIAIAAHALGSAKLIAQGHREKVIPHYISDLWHHSVIHQRNRSVPPLGVPGSRCLS
jgi:GT2 family glycosyltransferase